MQSYEGLIQESIEDRWLDSLTFAYLVKCRYKNSMIFNYSSRSLGEKLNISHSTVAKHIRLLRKLKIVKSDNVCLLFLLAEPLIVFDNSFYFNKIKNMLRLHFLLKHKKVNGLNFRNISNGELAEYLKISIRSIGELKLILTIDFGCVFSVPKKNPNKEQKRETLQNYYINNKAQINKYKRSYRKRKYESSPLFVLAHRIRCRIASCLRDKRFSKDGKTEQILGASFSLVEKYIEKQFLPGMSWENRQLWHIDHKIPLASAKNEKELLLLFHYTNLQPLWAKENILKSDKILPIQIALPI